MPKRRAAAGPKPQLQRHAAAARVEALLKERDRLLREVEKKRRSLAQTRAEAARISDEALARMRPIVERERSLQASLKALFDELLREGRLAPRARKAVARVRAFLALAGVLPLFDEDPNDLTDDDDDDVEQEAGGPNPWDVPPRHSRAARGAAAAAPEVQGAPQTGQQRRSLRDIFRNLARLVHPDHARQEGERQRRTDVMKQVTRAYEDGDLARLIEIESAWQSEAEIRDGDPEARVRELERLNRELLDQLRDLTAALRDSKWALREAHECFADDATVALAMRELDEVAAVAELLQRFRDGKSSLADLKQGPWAAPPRRRSRAE